MNKSQKSLSSVVESENRRKMYDGKGPYVSPEGHYYPATKYENPLYSVAFLLM